MNSIVFVDFDGVLTSTLPYGGSYLSNPPEDYHMSKDCFANLMMLLLRTNSKVIVSSNWRRYPPDGYWTHSAGDGVVKKYYNQIPYVVNALGDRYVGTLPTDRHLTKSEALILWLEEQKEIPPFVVFDDDLREGFQTATDYGISKKFILTNPKLGLTMTDVNKAIDMLKKQGCQDP